MVMVRKKAHDFLDKKHPDVRHDVLSEDTFLPGIFVEYAYAQSLFGANPPLLLDMLLRNEVMLEEFLLHVAAFAQSPHTFIVINEKLPAAVVKTLREHAASFLEVAPAKVEERFNTFLLADAFARKDKKALWVLLMRAYSAGVSGEEIAGTLFWQIKSARLAARTKSGEEAGMKSFPYNKAKAVLKHFDETELHRHSLSLIALYHEGHAGKDMDIALEKFVLTI